jgi:isoprene-epoxide---glutathione S-transferase
MITLYQYIAAWGLPDISPFVTKVDCYLSMVGLPYQLARFQVTELGKTAKGKLPIVEDQGRRLADSGFIIDYLKAAYGDTLDARLSLRERAVGVALRRLMEESLYWSAIIQTRWREDANFALYRPSLSAMIDFPADQCEPAVDQFRRQILTEFHEQGMGRHTAEENYELAKTDLAALADYLGDQPYFFGQQPTTLDAAAYAWVAHIINVPFRGPVKEYAQSRQNLVAYCRRMRERYYPEAPSP